MKRTCGAIMMGLMIAAFAFAAEKADTTVVSAANDATDKAAFKRIDTGKKILVVYFSLTGNTERVGKDIADRFGADVETIIDKKKRTGFFGFMGGGRDATFKKLAAIEPMKLDPSNYDITILGTPIWAWSMTPAIRTYITLNKDKFKEVAFFITSGGTPAERIVPSMEKLSGKKGLAYVGFNRKELKDSSLYQAKLTKFLESFKRK